MTNEDNFSVESKAAVENGVPLDKFGVYLRTFQRDIPLKEGLLFNENI